MSEKRRRRKTRAEVREERQQEKSKKGRGRLGCLLVLVLVLVGGFAAYSYFADNLEEDLQSRQGEGDTEQVYDVDKVQLRDGEVDTSKEPFSILFLGIDTGEYDRKDWEGGRSDIMLVATINPKDNTSTLTSIPRDSYVEISGTGEMDKINHAYAYGGVNMSVNTVQDLLDIPIDYYAAMDMGGFVEIIDTIGGVTITPIETFEQEGYYFEEGETQVMDGATALQYIRNRYTDTGDYGRQERARQVVEATADEVLSLGTVTQLGSLYDDVINNVETNIDLGTIRRLATSAKEILANMQTLQLEGEGTEIDGIYYEELDPDNVAEVSSIIQKELLLAE